MAVSPNADEVMLYAADLPRGDLVRADLDGDSPALAGSSWRRKLRLDEGDRVQVIRAPDGLKLVESDVIEWAVPASVSDGEVEVILLKQSADGTAAYERLRVETRAGPASR